MRLFLDSFKDSDEEQQEGSDVEDMDLSGVDEQVKELEKEEKAALKRLLEEQLISSHYTRCD